MNADAGDAKDAIKMRIPEKYSKFEKKKKFSNTLKRVGKYFIAFPTDYDSMLDEKCAVCVNNFERHLFKCNRRKKKKLCENSYKSIITGVSCCPGNQSLI